MCLGVPGQVVEWLDRDPVFGRASVEFAGVRRVCHMACVPDAEVGEYVIVHAGIAISRIDAEQAERLLDELRTLDMDDELPPPTAAASDDATAGERSP
ncbi:HypC/HybG/HupF family hydrogenase formation chaperone [Maioricimonas sp. JC845]|uniref:HypC/HybG/HupF family hydrogenase formation chaperone n=1 Tax=Maioricimonas sp. JC845 TaxID=3232138 RepID=UPI00345904F3